MSIRPTMRWGTALCSGTPRTVLRPHTLRYQFSSTASYSDASLQSPSTQTLRSTTAAPSLETASAGKKSSTGRRTFLTALAFGIAGYSLALAFPPSYYKLLFPAPVPLAPTAESPEGVAYIKSVEDQLQELPIVKQLRQELLTPETTSANATSLTAEQTSKARKWKEVRPYDKMPVDKKRHSLTHYTLRGPGKFAVAPLMFYTDGGKDCIAIMHVGANMCGHNGIIHGGLLATILDEALARPAFAVLPNHIGMTVYLNTRYKAPTRADQFIVVRSKASKWEGRKAFTEGTIETLDGKLLVQSEALYVEPKDAWLLKTSSVKEALGEAGIKE